MPKIKTNRGAAKRFKVSKSGKIMRRRGFTSHILSTKSRKRKRRLRQAASVSGYETKSMRRLIPYL
ncbi:MAG: 50S ribosomal protein L35 [Deltaproteobacteria bacterium]|nr:50S ribosomal protein L35 [Deltaproteobacteria bacterium]